LDGRGHRREDVAVVVQLDLEPERRELVAQQPQQVELLRGRRVRRRVGIRLRVDADVAEEPLGGVLRQLGRELAQMITGTVPPSALQAAPVT
jgi:hypothetical protein